MCESSGLWNLRSSHWPFFTRMENYRLPVLILWWALGGDRGTRHWTDLFVIPHHIRDEYMSEMNIMRHSFVHLPFWPCPTNRPINQQRTPESFSQLTYYCIRIRYNGALPVNIFGNMAYVYLHVGLPLNPSECFTQLILFPRSNIWYFHKVQMYCSIEQGVFSSTNAPEIKPLIVFFSGRW